MEYFSVRLIVLLIVAVVATVFTFRIAWGQKAVGRRHLTAGYALCLLGLLGLVPIVRERIKAIPIPNDSATGYWLVGTVLLTGVLLGLVLVGRKRLTAIAHDIIARARIALEERRDPELRRRNACVRRYERVLRVLHEDDPSRRHKLRAWRHDEMVRSVIQDLTDEDIAILSEFLVVHMLEGRSPPDVFVFFLKGERRRAARDEYEMRGHLVRLSVVAGRLQQENAA